MTWKGTRWEKLQQFRGSDFFILAVVNLGVLIDTYMYSLIVPVLPFTLVNRIGVPEDQVQGWIGVLLALHGVGVVVGSPVVGWFADRTESRQGPFLLGLLALAGSLLAQSLGRSLLVFLTGRLLQGISATIVWTVGFAIVADTVGEGQIGPAMGCISVSVAVGVLSGPIVGGLLYDQLGYHALFMSAYILVGIDMLMRLIMIEKPKKTTLEKLARSKVLSYGTITEETIPVKDGLKNGIRVLARSCSSSSSISDSCSYDQFTSHSATLDEDGWDSEPASKPVLFELLSSPRMLAALYGCFAYNCVTTILQTVLPLRLKNVLSVDSTQIALLFLPFLLPSFAAPLAGRLSDRYGAKTLATFGCLFAAPPLVLLRLIDHNGIVQIILLSVLLALARLAMLMISTPAMAEVTYVVDEKERLQPGIFGQKGAYAQGFALMNMAFASASLVGPLLGGLVAERAGWNVLTFATGSLMAVSAFPIYLATGGRGPQADPGDPDD